MAIEKIMPSQGMPLGGLIDEEIEVEVEQVEDPTEMIEQEDGSVLLNFEEQLQEQLQAEPDANLAEVLDERELMRIADDLIGLYMDDRSSRDDWEDSYVNGLGLLGIKYEEREEPFRGSSGVTHPVIAEAVTQFQAQAYKELLPSSGPVRTQIIGATNPEVEAQSERVKEFMNYQIIHVMDEFDPETDRLLFYLPLAGSAFKKVYFDDLLDRAVARFVPADDLVVPYNATDLNSAARITHVIRMPENDVRKFQAGGFYREVDLVPYDEDDKLRDKERALSGIQKTTDDKDCTLLEVHTDLDLPGFEHISPLDNEPTGIKLPYIVTLDEGSSKILSIRRNLREGDEFFRKYPILRIISSFQGSDFTALAFCT